MGQMMAAARSEGYSTSTAMRVLLVCVVAIASGFHLWGIQKELPFTHVIDEPSFVVPAVRIASTGNLNPGWFGHPGSTVIYPLAGIYRGWHAVTRQGMLFRPDPNLQARFDSHPSEFYLLGRLLSIAYSLMSIPMVYGIGRRLFGEQVGLVGSFFSMLFPLIVTYAQLVRSDAAALFFGLLGLWLCLRVHDRPNIKNQLLAGTVIGLGIATRYFLVLIVPVLLVVGQLGFWQQTSQPRKIKGAVVVMVAGLLAVVASFTIAAPFFFLDFNTALKDWVPRRGVLIWVQMGCRRWGISSGT